ncbi:tyrosine-type recombinase/integrase [Micromonospora sp. NPDC052213]|uniref:tyrosine-type recombinase/integrase n=1 Tax=Micromonospora sp. NPDC052213 TaxID=3155812 RepID=UPI003413D1CE
MAPRGNHWRYEDFYEGRWVKIRDLAQEKGLPRRMTMHGLRYSLLTLLATEGVDLAALRTMAGHASVTTTMNVYVHTTPAAPRAGAADRRGLPWRRPAGGRRAVGGPVQHSGRRASGIGSPPAVDRLWAVSSRKSELLLRPRRHRFPIRGPVGMMGRWTIMSCAAR